ncbi:hypothetical protein Tco_0576103 [Tanacetum coccineum]
MAAGVVVGDTMAQVDLKLNKVESKPTGSNKDNVHEIGHVSSVDNIDHLRIHGSVLLIYCAYAFFTDVRFLARQPHLDCGCNHVVCVSFNFVESGRMAERKNWSPQQPP